MGDSDLRKIERAYLALLRARYAARAARAPEPRVVRRPPAKLLQGIDRIGEGPVPARIDEMRAVDVPAASHEPEAARLIANGAQIGLAEVLSSVTRVSLHGSPADSENTCAWLAYGCARLGWAYRVMGWPFQPVPVVLEGETDIVQPDLETCLAVVTASTLAEAEEPWGSGESGRTANRLVDAWRRQRRLMLLIKVPAAGHGHGTGWQRAAERWLEGRGSACPVILIGNTPALPYSLARWFCPFSIEPAHVSGPVEALPAPAAASADPDARLRALEVAVYSAGQSGDPSCAELLVRGLRDFCHEVRGAAAAGLGLVGGAETAPALAMAMGDPLAGVRVAATAALGQIAAQADLESGGWARTPIATLAKGLDAYYADVRAAAALALGGAAQLIDRGVAAPTTVARLIPLLHDRSPTVRESAAAALGMVCDSALAPLLAALHAEQVAVRILAIRALGSSDETAARVALAGALRDSAAQVRAAAALALGTAALVSNGAALAEDDEATKELLAAAIDDEAEVRLAVAEALGDIGGIASAEAAVRLLGDNDPRVRSTDANALVRLGKQATQSLLGALGSPDPAVRWLAIHVLGVRSKEEGGDNVAEGLAAAMADPYSAVRWLAAETLGSLKNAAEVGEQQDVVRAVLAGALHDRNPLVRGAARAALE